MAGLATILYFEYNCVMWIFSSEENIIIKEYSKNPINNIEMDVFSVKYHEWNFICWDDITIFLFIEKEIVKKCSYIWNLSIVSLASAELISEIIIWMNLKDLFNWDYNFIKDQGISVSNKRKRAAVLPILAIRNAIHQYLDDGIVDDFDDILEN